MIASDTEELRLVNAMIGFCKRMRGTWPRPLQRLGYEPCGIGWDIKVLLNNRDRSVPADLICASVRLDHALCVEAKSSTVEQDQAARYRAVTRAGLVNSGAIPPRLDVSRLTHDVMYLASNNNAETVSWQLSDFGVGFPVVSAGVDQFVTVSGKFGRPEVQKVFASGVEVDSSSWPNRFVPFTSRSEISRIAPFFCRSLSELLIRGQPFVSIQLAERAVPHWKLCGPREQRDILGRLNDLLEQGRLKELRGYYARTNPPGAPKTWTPAASTLVPPHETQRLARRLSEFRTRVSSGMLYQEPLHQMPMFEGLNQVSDAGSESDIQDEEADWWDGEP